MKIQLLILFICITTVGVKSQNSQDAQENYRKAREDEWVKKNKQVGQPTAPNLQGRTVNNNNPDLPSEKPTVSTSPNRNIVDLKQMEMLEKKVKEFIDQINREFSIPAEYNAKYNIFLNQNNNGIARMFPDKNCDDGLTVTVERLAECAGFPKVKGSGSRYSIRFNWLSANIHPQWLLKIFDNADMHFTHNSLVVGNERNLSIISEIGKIDMNQISLKSDFVKHLSKFKSPTSFKEFKEQKIFFNKGTVVSGSRYAESAEVKTNSTYIFRSIAYPLDKSYPETDLLFALQIVGKEEDGSIIFIWKKLREKKSPFIKFNENSK